MSYDKKIQELKKEILQLELVWICINNDKEFNDELHRLERIYGEMKKSIDSELNGWSIIETKKYEETQANALLKYIYELKSNKYTIYNQLQNRRNELNEIDTQYRQTLLGYLPLYDEFII